MTFDLLGDDDVIEDNVTPVLAAIDKVQAANPDLRVEQFGDASTNKALSKAFEDDLRKAETLSLPITLVILVVAFGALAAAGVPLLLGDLGSRGGARPGGRLQPGRARRPEHLVGDPADRAGRRRRLLALLPAARTRGESGGELRGGLAAGRRVHIRQGRARLGVTVIIAMAGMYVTGNATFISFATGTIIVVAIAVLGSLTVLPAVLSKLGDRVEWGRVPFRRRMGRGERGEAGLWAAIVERVLRRPVISLVLGTAVLVVLAIPAFSLHTVNTGVNGIPRDLPIMQTYDRIQAAFPGEPLSAIVAVEAPNVESEPMKTAIARLNIRAVVHRRVLRAGHHDHQPGQDGRRGVDPDRGERHRRQVGRRARGAARRRHPVRLRPCAGRERRRNRDDRRSRWTSTIS